MIPSPDWFVGVDSLDLCVDSSWVDEVTLDVRNFLFLSFENNSVVDDLHNISNAETVGIEIFKL